MNRLGKALVTGLFVFALGNACAAAQAIPVAAVTVAPPLRPTPAPVASPLIVRDYVLGDSGEDVYAFKQRVQALGYFDKTASLSDSISQTTLERVNRLLEDNGMEPVTTITIELQEIIYTRDDFALAPLPTPSPTPQPILAPQGTPALPALDEQGFLADAAGEYVFQDPADGLWYYISNTLYVNIRRYTDPEEKSVWLETEVRTRGETVLESLGGEKGAGTQTPVAIARANKAVLAFTDDFFTMREYGVAIRGGEIRRNYIRKSSGSYPRGDTLAVFADGTMRAFDYNEYTAQEYLAMGVHDVLTFGPWLVRGGEINPKLLNGTYMHYREPRCALGMIAPGHYLILTVDGRYDGAKGTYIDWLAARMHEAGVTEAINLDGGGTTALVFMGTQLSRVASAKPDGANTRKVSSLLGFGTSSAVPD